MLDRFDLTVHVLPASGVTIALTSAHLPVGEGGEQVSFVGKGFDPGDAVRRCLGEMAEFHSWLYDPAQDRARVALEPPQPRLPGVAELLDCRVGWSRQDEAALQARGWSRVVRLTGAEPFSTWCPAPLCFGRYIAPDRAAPEAGLDNSGCAAGRSRDEALEGALLEAIERDATGLWWQRGIARPGIDPHGIASARLRHGLEAHDDETGRRCWFLDLTTDIAIPVVAAISIEDDGTLPALGVACRPHLADAMEGAFLEMVQSELALAALLQRLDEGEPSPGDAELARWYELVDPEHAPWLAPQGVAGHLPTRGMGTPLERLAACGFDAYAMELTRAALGIPVVKVIVPGLAHFRRRQGAGRLAGVPEQFGWRSWLPGDGTFNPTPLLI
ncbi:YcaO-like family protein [Starkeya sp. ORNL1]|uniref:YcaO-like family protein n=1 Tax=Starkeya sp. ORNL1 TaxID=2709380 RepID=UPI001464A3D3|nr:YcaO-like family protein [Starkeya sp. ORNL1]QJP16171.1 YcaO-like family protein [Starkeya sp. ORNL1]